MAHPSLNCSPDEECYEKSWMMWFEDQFLNLSLAMIAIFIMLAGFVGGVSLMLLIQKN